MAEFGGHLFDIPIIYTDPNSGDFDESYTQGRDTVIVPRSYFHDSSDGQNRESCPTSDPSVVHPSDFKSHGQSQDLETATDQQYNDNHTTASDPSPDVETTYEPMQQPPPKQSDSPSTIETNDPNTDTIPENGPSYSRGGKNNSRPYPNPNYSEIYRH